MAMLTFAKWGLSHICSLLVNGTPTVNTSTSDFCERFVYDLGVPPKTEKLLAEIKAWCEANEIKQVQLAGMLGVKRSAVTDWYAGRKTPTAEQVLTMLELLKTKPK
jgi:predicted transcriptional regulator